MKTITVVLSDDHTVFREGLRLLLDAAGDIEVIGEAENGNRAVGETKRLRPDVAIMDIAMPLLNGVEAARKIAKEVPATKVLILSSYNDDQYVQRAIEAGAAGYLMKETATEDLLRAIHEVHNGNPFFSPPIAQRLLKRWNNCGLQPRSTNIPVLTPRQLEVVRLIAEGFSSKQMAEMLSLSVKTIEKHRQTAMNKLDIHEIATLTRYAVFNGVAESKICVEPAGPAGTHATNESLRPNTAAPI
jgi:DNA-binding NarL/FixJ family response regulator